MTIDDTPKSLEAPADLKKYKNLNEIFQDYEIEANKSVKMIVCMFSSLNMAIEMDFATMNGGPKATPVVSEQQVAAVDNLMCCQFHSTMDGYLDKVKRVKLISMFVDLMVYDLDESKDGVFANDFEDLLEEFMMDQYTTEIDESDLQ